MMTYPKINSIYKRDEKTKALVLGDYSCPEFSSIDSWYVEEKIDGTNIRIFFDPFSTTKVIIKGRKNDSDVPEFVSKYIISHFTYDLLSSVFGLEEKVILFGEAYGNRIQAAGTKYDNSVSFMLFDVVENGEWRSRQEVKNRANLLSVPFPPFIGIMSEPEVLDYIKSNPMSILSKEPQVIEGIIARAPHLSFFPNGDPIVWKIKTRDRYDR